MAFQPFKNVGSQVLELFAFDVTTGLPKTGDAANITAYVTIDGGTVTVLADTSATEKSSANAPGWYQFDLAQGETNGDHILYTGKSSTSTNISIVGIDTNSRPAAFGLVAGATNGLLIAGTNAATTFSGLTTGALAITTLTASGAVAFQSTFAVTTSTALGALSCTTLTASGAVALQSTVGITGAVTLSSTLGVGATTLSALTVTNNMLVSGTTTHTGAVSFGSTFGITGTTTLAAVNTGAIGTGTITTTGNLAVSGTVTLTGAVTASNAGNNITGVSAVVTDKTGFSLTAAYDAAKTAATQASVDSVQSDTDNIQTRLPAALTGAGNMKADTVYVNGTKVNGVGTAGNPWGP